MAPNSHSNSLTWFFKNAQRVTNKLIPVDSCLLLVLSLDDRQVPQSFTPDFEFRFLSVEDVAQANKNLAADLNDRMLDLMKEQGLRCFGAFRGDTLLGYAWVADGTVAPEHNTGGHQFKGVGLQLEPDASYLFKCFVLPEQRGQGVNQQLLWKLGEALQDDGKTKLFTTTSWSNRAFQTSSRRIGFKTIGRCTEYILLGKSFFSWSKPEPKRVKFFKP